MMGRRELAVPHAMPAVSLSASTCSHSFCSPTVPPAGAHPNDRDAETLIAARAAIPE